MMSVQIHSRAAQKHRQEECLAITRTGAQAAGLYRSRLDLIACSGIGLLHGNLSSRKQVRQLPNNLTYCGNWFEFHGDLLLLNLTERLYVMRNHYYVYRIVFTQVHDFRNAHCFVYAKFFQHQFITELGRGQIREIGDGN